MLKEKNTFKEKLTINAVQNGIFYMLFILLPLAVIPTPWDWMERGSSLLILIITTVLASLELVKFVLYGKFSIFKNGIDAGILIVFISLLISAIFSVDLGISFWGIDVSLGSGLMSVAAVILLCFIMRSFIDTLEEITKVLTSISVGITIINILSLLSFFNIDFLKGLPAYSEVFTYGLPWTLSSYTLLILDGIAIFLSIALIEFKMHKDKKIPILNISTLALSVISLSIFSINQGSSIVILLILVLSLLLFFSFRKIRFSKESGKKIQLLVAVSLASVILLFSIFRISDVKDNIFDSFKLLTQVSLGSEISWKIVSSGMTENFLRAVIGYGESLFVSLYNLYKPVTTEVLSFNGTNFYYGSSEILTGLAEGGFVWLAAWSFLGYLIIKEFVLEVKDLGKLKNVEGTFISLSLSFTSLFVFFSSLFCHFDITVKLMLFVILSLWITAKNISKIKLPNKFVFKMFALDTNASKKNSGVGINIFVISFIALASIVLLSVWSRILISDIYISSAEYYITSKNEENLSDSEKIEFLLNAVDRYSKAESFFGDNSLVNRKLSMLNLEIVSAYADEYSSTIDENKKTEIENEIGVYRRETISQEQKSIDRNPSLYDNWQNSSNVYLGLVSIGFSDYSTDALNSLSKAIDLNPSNYELYYNAAQVYMTKDDTDSALSSLVQALEINPLHVPSLLLTGEINGDLGKNDVYLSYLKAAKTVMEEYSQTNSDTYKDVLEKISKLSSSDSDDSDK